MASHYFKAAFRNLVRNKLAAVISIAGLAIALAGVFLVYAYVRWEMSYNTHFTGMENVYRVLRSTRSESGAIFSVRSSGPLAPALAESYPEVESAYRLLRRKIYVGTGETGDTALVCVADENVFELLGLDPQGRPLHRERHPQGRHNI